MNSIFKRFCFSKDCLRKAVLALACSCISITSHAALVTWGGGNGNWDNCNKWVGCCSPGNGDSVLVCGGSPTHSSGSLFVRCCQTFTFSGGACVTHNSGNPLIVGRNGNNTDGTINISGASTLNFGGGSDINVGNGCGTGTVTMTGGSTLCFGCCSCFEVGFNDCTIGTMTVTDSTITMTDGQFRIGGGNSGTEGHGTLILCNSSFTSTSEDLDMNNGGGGTAYLCIKNGSNFNIAASLILRAADNNAQSTVNIDGSTANIGSFAMGCSSATMPCSNSYVYVTGGSQVIADHDCNPDNFRSSIGCLTRNNRAVLEITGACSKVEFQYTAGDKAGSCIVSTGDRSRINVGNGGLLGNATGNCMSTLRLSGSNPCAACSHAVLSAKGTCAVGTVNMAIELDGGTFNDGTVAGEVLVLAGAADSITQNGVNDEFIINGSGTIRLGGDDLIDDSSDDIDIDLNGGTLDINGMNLGSDPGGGGSTIGALTLANGSTIAMKSGDATQDVYLKGMSITGTINVTGWGGTGGVSNAGTGGRLIFNGRPNGWADDDNSGAGFDGVNWGGALGTKSELVSLGGGLYELVPLGMAVPESSTLFATGGLLLLVAYHFLRKRTRSI